MPGFNHCPKCGEEVDREEVDIGVGIMYGPAYCQNCDWSSEEEARKLMERHGLEEE